MVPITQLEKLVKDTMDCPVGSIIRGCIYREAVNAPQLYSLKEMRFMGAYSLMYTLQGEGAYLDMRGVAQALHPGDLVQVFPDIGHRYLRNSDKHWKEISLVFNGPVFDLWRRQGLLNDRRPIVRLEPISYWSHRFETVARASAEQTPLESICALMQLLAEINRYEQTRGASDDERSWLESAKKLLEAEIPQEEFQLEQVAEQLGDSYVGFRKRFTRLTGISPARYHMKIVIDRARELIRRQGMTNRQVTDRLGFGSEYYFSRRFKQLAGVSPREFRQQVMREQ